MKTLLEFLAEDIPLSKADLDATLTKIKEIEVKLFDVINTVHYITDDPLKDTAVNSLHKCAEELNDAAVALNDLKRA